MHRRILVTLSMAVMLLGGLGAVSACNTIGGVGEDVSAAGKGVTRGAETTKQKM